MKYENKEAFEQVNMFGTGTPNTAYSKFFIGDAFLNPLTDPKGIAQRTTFVKAVPPQRASRPLPTVHKKACPPKLFA